VIVLAACFRGDIETSVGRENDGKKEFQCKVKFDFSKSTSLSFIRRVVGKVIWLTAKRNECLITNMGPVCHYFIFQLSLFYSSLVIANLTIYH